ncbi:MAG: hypothetical protein B6229_09020 [Spirochaetaceae bacterium 4572_7]|nr:MAG: hypothetical protein B6229_09020 [Spirochaetaceae bacterium 4572_7]
MHGGIDNIINKDNYLLHEINNADYLHEYTIDETIDKDSIKAEMSNGVLLLTLDLKKSEKPRKIEVKNS